MCNESRGGDGRARSSSSAWGRPNVDEASWQTDGSEEKQVDGQTAERKKKVVGRESLGRSESQGRGGWGDEQLKLEDRSGRY
jgi:hypothetical protein